MIERELVRCHTAFLQDACDRVADLPVDRVPPEPASGDVADGAGPADFFLAQIVLAAAVPARGIVVMVD